MATFEERIDAAAEAQAEQFAGRACSEIVTLVKTLAGEVLEVHPSSAQAQAFGVAVLQGGEPPVALVNLARARIVARLEGLIPEPDIPLP